MNENQTVLLSRIYRLADQRIRAAGSEMPCSEELFTALAAVTPGTFDYPLLANLNNGDFLSAAFQLLLERPLDDGTRAAWQDRIASLPAEEFHTAALHSVLCSDEYRQHQVLLLRCPLAITEEAQPVQVQIATSRVPDWLMRVYRRLPAPLKKLAKKLAGKRYAG